MTNEPEKKTNFDLDAYMRWCHGCYIYFNQGAVWLPKKSQNVAIAEMDTPWRFNCTRFLERRASFYAHCYTFGEFSALSSPKFREVIGSNAGRVFSELDMMGEHSLDAYDMVKDDRERNPVEWIRTTTLYRALAKGLPTKPKKVAALADRARHWSTCPARESADAECECATIQLIDGMLA